MRARDARRSGVSEPEVRLGIVIKPCLSNANKKRGRELNPTHRPRADPPKTATILNNYGPFAPPFFGVIVLP